jgi:hypothetical protein
MLVALWPLASNHCKLEQLPGLNFLVCFDHDDAPYQDNDCDTDGCAAFEDGFYKTEDGKVGVTAPAFIVLDLDLRTLEANAQPPNVRAAFSTFASPELPATWQFSFRTALPPRAPCLAS